MDPYVFWRGLRKQFTITDPSPGGSSASGSGDTDQALTADEYTPLLKERNETKEELNQQQQQKSKF